ncbi:prepilin peptidase [Mycobacterium antarcticum]|uniref:prepilin peptidase n=1 Tax=unclassified Mycolicibacterium TaxID=2636767 RepID=UPI00238C82B3|nr:MULTISPECIES: A24 family peptidase [unclassified Mycolicibacterium]BDX32691.1 prepilin peptidase [Mycolicibacterium sp. TUM20985]GLP75899.1 prepilin peptidase [Mycolicibacterium sp. TUM20983]GLP83757.1 prepilin peptidase [Mycolicibacterium sp. TUM20984]
MGEAVAGACALTWLTALTVYDVRQRRLPNALTLPGAVVVLTVAALAGRGQAALVGAAALTVIYLVVHLLSPAAMGAGDVKLALGIGALTGAYGVDAWVLAAITAPLLTALLGVGLRARGTGASAVPHGPAMCVSAIAAVALVAG